MKLFDIIQVKNKDLHFFYKKYFREVYLAQTNTEALELYKKHHIPIIFLYCNKETEDTINVLRELNELNNNIIIVVISYLKPSEKLLQLLNYNITAHVDEIFQKGKIQKTLQNIYRNLPKVDSDMVLLLDNYTFDKKNLILYDQELHQIKLTKQEMKLLEILSKKVNEYVLFEILEYQLYEDLYGFDCSLRVKNLLFRIRKKLPPNSIVNSYQLGYKLCPV